MHATRFFFWFSLFQDEDDAEMRLLWGNLVLSMFTLFTVLTLEGEPSSRGRVVLSLILAADMLFQRIVRCPPSCSE